MNIENLNRARNAALAAILAAGLSLPVTGLAYAADDNASEPETTDVKNKLNNLISEEDENVPTKSESVYVFANADGSVKNTVVTAWLKNAYQEAALHDISSLTDIKNTEGKESFEAKGESLVWDAQGSDIYYQGNTDKQAPVQIKVTYWLDGKETAPADLLGKSGHVKIRFDYRNDSSSTEYVDGAARTVYTPFVCVTGMILDNGIFKNITTENAKTMNDGDRTMVGGIAFPGLQDDLGIDADTVDFPDYFEVEADVTNFEMGTTATLVTSNLLDNLNTDELNTSEVGDALNELADATNQLVDGSSKLYDGLQQLEDGADALANGTSELADKTAALPDGISALADGANAVESGAGQLADGTSGLKSGLSTLKTGLEALTYGTDSTTGLADALASIGTTSDTGSDTLQGGVNQIKGGLAQLKGGSAENPGLTGAQTGVQNLKTAASGTKDGVKDVANSLESLKSSLSGDQLTTLEKAIEALSEDGNVYKGIAGIEVGLQQIDGGLTTAIGGVDQLSAGADKLSTGLSTMKDGTGEGTLPNGKTSAGLSGAVDALESKIIPRIGSESDTSSDTLMGGTNQIAGGAKALKDGASKLANGANQLKDAAPALMSGITALQQGSAQLADGMDAAADGSKALRDGMKKFDEEGIQKLLDAYNENLAGLGDRLKATADAGKAYNTFTGKSDAMKGTVKFIYETDAIEADD